MFPVRQWQWLVSVCEGNSILQLGFWHSYSFSDSAKRKSAFSTWGRISRHFKTISCCCYSNIDLVKHFVYNVVTKFISSPINCNPNNVRECICVLCNAILKSLYHSNYKIRLFSWIPAIFNDVAIVFYQNARLFNMSCFVLEHIDNMFMHFLLMLYANIGFSLKCHAYNFE